MKGLLSRLTCGLMLFVLAPGLALAQDGVITGTVTDQQTEDSLPGATVLVTETGVGTATDIDGNYRITGVSPGTKTLRVSFVGYRTIEREVEVQAGETVTADFSLQPSLAEMEEVVVTGVTSETPKAKLSFTVEQVSADKLEKAPASNAMEALRGKVAGAQFVQSSGEPGRGISVRLRATNSLTGDNSPLFIVDGVILGADQVDIGALDIKNIEVVKGAAASSLYGSRAQNGVINITTKRGSETSLGQTRVTIRNEFGIQNLQDIPHTSRSHPYKTNDQGQLLNSDGEVINYGGGAALDNSGPHGTVFQDNRYEDLRKVSGEPYTLRNPFKQFYDTGNTWTNYVAVSQNSEATNFRVSFANERDQGVIQGPVSTDGYGRKEFRLNLDHRPADNVSIAASGFYSQSNNDPRDGTEVEDPFFSLMFLTPLSNILERDANGELLVRPDPNAIEVNPAYMVENYNIDEDRSRFLGNLRGEYSPFRWLTLQGNLSYDRSDRKRTETADRGFKTIDPAPENDGEIEKQVTVQEALNYDVTASLNRDFGDFTGRAQFKYQVENTEFQQEWAQGNDFAVKGNFDFSNITDDASKQLDSYRSLIKSEAFYASAEGDYMDRYIVDLLLRRDGSSLFGANERWQTYYRAAGAYRISEEDFWPFQNSLNEFKLRYSYGTAGARPNFQAQYETFDLSNGTLSKSTLGNADLKPEFSTEQEFGVEMGFFDRVFIEAAYVDNRVEDQLLRVPLLGPAGFEEQWQNAGTLESNTIEVSLNATALRTRDMGLDFGVTFDRTRQKITEFNTNAFRTGPLDAFFYRAGEQIGAMYGAKWITEQSELQTMGLDPSKFSKNDEGYFVPVGSGNTFKDGFNESACEGGCWGTTVSTAMGNLRWGIPIKFVDSEGSDFHQIGNTVPNFNLNFNTNFTFKGFSAYALLSYQNGGDVYNHTKQWAFRDGRHAQQDQSGKAQGLKKPDLYYRVLYDTNALNSHYIEDATFLKLRELSVGYTFDQAQLNRLIGGGNFLHRVSLHVTGRNLFTVTDYTGIDPEVGDGSDATLFRVDDFDYPPFRTFTGRLEIQF